MEDETPPPDASGAVHYGSDFGIIATNRGPVVYPHSVAPSTADSLNTFALDLTPVACVGLADVLFEFDSSFVSPDVRSLLERIPSLREARKSKTTGDLPLLSVFGHADPVGDDNYNKTLSGRRAKAIHGLLIQDASEWDTLYSNPFHGDNWQTSGTVKRMRSHLGDGAPQARHDLFAAYMASICPFTLTKADFLGRGAAGGKADYQGCGEFNPVLLLSKSESATLSKTDRDEENRANRRVIIYLFAPAVLLNPNLWPCPRAEEGVGGCHKRFFADGEARRAPGNSRREFADAEDTFACRFYSRVAIHSSCERPARALPTVWLRVLIEDERKQPRRNLRFDLTIDGVPVYSDSPLQTDDDGYFDREVPADSTEAVLTFDEHTVALTLSPEIPPVDTVKGLQIRLRNLGYHPGPVDGQLGQNTQNALMQFQKDSQLKVTGRQDAETNAALVTRFGR